MLKKISMAPIELIIIFFYFITHILLILDGSVYWDDWVWYNNHEQLAMAIKELGFGPLGIFLEFIYNNQFGITFSKIVIFSLGLLSGLLLKKILDEFPYFNRESKIFLVLFFLMAPLNATKSSLCVSNNICANFLFYLGSYLLIRSANFNNFKKIMLKILAMVCLFVSYFTNSFLVFTSVLYFAYFFKVKEKTSDKRILFYVKELLPFISLPIVFWIIKKKFFMPSGFYENYNQLDLFNLKPILKGLYRSIYEIYAGPPEVILSFPRQRLKDLLLVVLAGFSYCFIKGLKAKNLHRDMNLIFFTLGVIALLIAVFPYLVVNKAPDSGFHNSRFQLLMPLGYAFSAYYLLSFVLESMPRIKQVAMWATIIVLYVLNLNSYIHVYTIKSSQDALMLEFSSNPIYRENRLFFMDYFNTSQSPSYPVGAIYYEYAGMFLEVFHEQTRLPVMNNNEINFASEGERVKKRYKLSDTILPDNYVKVVIRNTYRLKWGQKIKMIMLSIFDQKTYRDSLRKMFQFNYEIRPTAELTKKV